SKGRRVFDISLEGKLVKGSFDIFVEGNNKETVLTFANIEVKDGKLNLDMVASRDRASISAISITGGGTKEQVAAPKAPAAPAAPVAPAFALHLNTGTDKDVTLGGVVFKGDRNFKDYFNASHEANNPAASKDQLYQTERNAHSLSYAIPVPNGVYTVKTYHNEQYWGKGGPAASKGRRVFDISLEGKLVKGSFDIFVEGNNKETVLTFANIEVKDGKLNLDMVASRDRASISAISIVNGTAGGKNASSRMTDVNAPEAVTTFAEEVQAAPLEVKLYPNPAKEWATVSVNHDIELAYILIHDMNGKLMQQLDPVLIKAETGQYKLSLANLGKGIYLISVV